MERPQEGGNKLPQAGPMAPGAPSQEHRELVDFNWRPLSVPANEGTSFAIQNLSQDTSYEFYVRAKNIIGEGPRSQVVLASTKRAISGSLAPLNADAAASTSADLTGKFAHLCLLLRPFAPPLSLSL